MTVEPGLADRRDPGMLRQRDQLGRGDVGFLVGKVGMGADGTPHLVSRLRDGAHAGEVAHAYPDGEEAPDAGLRRAPHDVVEILGKLVEVEMTMAVDQHDGSAPIRRCGRKAGWLPASCLC